jgi:predicted RNA-binding protein with PIN domain
LLDVAGDTLRDLAEDEVPLALRHLRGFDRRRMMHGPGPRQLRRALELDPAFGARAIERFAQQTGVERLLDAWAHDDPWELVEECAAAAELPLLVSTLWACAARPGADYGLGMAVTVDAYARRDRGDAHDATTRDRQIAELQEALRRAEQGRSEIEAALARATQELRDERRGRRAREERAQAETQNAYRVAESLEAKLTKAESALEAERGRHLRESQRARALEEDVRKARAELAEATTSMAQSPSRLDDRDALELDELTAAMQRLATRLETLRSRVETSSEAPPRLQRRPKGDGPKPLAKRAQPKVPPGVLVSTRIGLESMLKSDGVMLVIDGYNVTKPAWPDATAAEQRERLGIAVTQLHRRLGCRVLCVFDGDGSGPGPSIRRNGVRVMFSDAGEEADEVVLREVRALPKRVPVVVASSDAWIKEHAEAEGAVVVPADALLRFLRPSR